MKPGAQQKKYYSDQLMNKGLFQEPHEQGSKAGCEIFLNNFVTENRQNNGQKSSRPGTTELKSGWGERRELVFFSLVREPESATEFRLWQPRAVLSALLSRGQKAFQKINGQLKNSVFFLLRWRSLGWAGEGEGSWCPMKMLGFYLSSVSSAKVFPKPQNSSQQGKRHVITSSVGFWFLFLPLNCCAIMDKRLYLIVPQVFHL